MALSDEQKDTIRLELAHEVNEAAHRVARRHGLGSDREEVKAYVFELLSEAATMVST